MEHFSHLPLLPEDPILGLQEAFLKDPHPNKLNFTIGTLTDPNGHVHCFNSVMKARDNIAKRPPQFGYGPLGGEKSFKKALYQFLLKERHPEDTCLFHQTVGGTGAVFHIFSLLKLAGIDTVCTTTPFWPNYPNVSKATGLSLKTVPHMTQEGLFDTQGLFKTVSSLTEKEALLLQFSCHNPTGVDPSLEEFISIFDLVKERHIPLILDIAYLGFASDPLKECELLQVLEDKKIPYFLALSFSKSLGLYGERVGAVARVSEDKEELARLESHLKHISRSTHSSTPRFGALIATEVLNSKELMSEWLQELSEVRSSIAKTREVLSEELLGALSESALRGLKRGRGLFSLLHLSKEEMNELRTFGIWCLENSRINIGSVSKEKLSYLVEVIRRMRK